MMDGLIWFEHISSYRPVWMNVCILQVKRGKETICSISFSHGPTQKPSNGPAGNEVLATE